MLSSLIPVEMAGIWKQDFQADVLLVCHSLGPQRN